MTDFDSDFIKDFEDISFDRPKHAFNRFHEDCVQCSLKTSAGEVGSKQPKHKKNCYFWLNEDKLACSCGLADSREVESGRVVDRGFSRCQDVDSIAAEQSGDKAATSPSAGEGKVKNTSVTSSAPI